MSLRSDSEEFFSAFTEHGEETIVEMLSTSDEEDRQIRRRLAQTEERLRSRVNLRSEQRRRNEQARQNLLAEQETFLQEQQLRQDRRFEGKNFFF